ncbi:hypothetical protein SA496_15730 [Pseudomonas sp. JS3066]|uniref:LysM peptidoglycan-binding domain-containing protein n=1 Tax=Pseudomonas sp. JS3066 TaxID=3090665 RepID=UPI002E7BD4D8|nr:hypothetical protein [Pseudomonas sp. JS3066]WVK91179.1 hypothetical protein SA496_15730 [Pseudomonas sp. JS3066]
MIGKHTLCNCPAGFRADPERHAPDCPGRVGAGKTSVSEQNKGHGHVIPRPDGNKTRCGGPGICKVCQQEQVDYARSTGASIFDVITKTAPGMRPKVSQDMQDAILDQMRQDGFSIDGDNAYKRDLLDCVVGALAFGKQGSTPPPEGHWLYRFWEIGDAERKERDALAARLTAFGKPVAVVDEGDDGQWAVILPDVSVKVGQQLYAAPIATEHHTYTTQPGESLAGIALRQLKDESRWVEIRDLNARPFPDMGPHDYYPVGTVLDMPASTSEEPSHG